MENDKEIQYNYYLHACYTRHGRQKEVLASQGHWITQSVLKDR